MTEPTDDTNRDVQLPEHRTGVLRDLVRDGALLERRLAELDVQPLLLVYTHLSGNSQLLDKLAPYIQGAWSFEQTVPEELKAELRRALSATLNQYVQEDRPLPGAPPRELLQRMCDVAVAGRVPDDHLPMVLEELNFDRADAKTVRWRKEVPDEVRTKYSVLVIGAGFSGLAMASKLADAGIPYVVIEKNADVGGTWLENSYPGVAVDTPNHFYSYSFRMNPDWDHYFARGPEILRYIRSCYAEMGVSENIRFEQEVVSLTWDEANAHWTACIRRSDGSSYELRANAVVSAAGLLNTPAYPDIAGMESFRGAMFHSARWDHDVDLSGKRVVMIGTGASGLQIGPAIAPTVGRLTIFQRSPHWARPNPLIFATVSDGVKWGISNLPYYNKWFRFLLLWATSDGLLPSLRKDPTWPEPASSLNAENARIREWLIAFMREDLNGDEELLAKVTPPFPPYGKRMLRAGNWYRTLTRDNVELLTTPIARITERGVLDKQGVEHPADVIVLATGFKAQAPLYPIHVVGKNGSIRDHWGDDDPRAHLGITVPDFPNLFLIYGPNTNLGHGGSALFHSECQIRYIMQALREMIEGELAALEVRREPYEDYNRRVDAEHAQLVWSHPGVTNWYKNKAGRVVTNSPWALCVYRNLTAEFNLSEYRTRRESSSRAR